MQKIHIIGLGVAETAVFSKEAKAALLNADLVIGAERQLETIAAVLSDKTTADTLLLPKLSDLQGLLEQQTNKIIAVLASGDPLYYGIGRWFTQQFDAQCLSFYPAVSSIQAACHECGLSLQDVEVISLHGRPLEKIRTKLHKNKTLVLLTDKNSQPQILAKECLVAGFSESVLTVCENLGYAQQQVRSFSVTELLTNRALTFDPLHVTVIKVAGVGGVLPEFPGIPDTNFITGAEPGKGMISKREVRLVILSLLQPTADDVIWDIGAGCGGVSVELAYWNDTATVYAVEHNEDRLRYLLANCQRFGVTHNVNIISGRAPKALEDLPKPSKIFIGGSDGELTSLLTQAWQLLPIGGLLVASAVMESTKLQLKTFSENNKDHVVESIEVSVKRGSLQKGEMNYQAKLPVEIFQFKKLSPSSNEKNIMEAIQ